MLNGSLFDHFSMLLPYPNPCLSFRSWEPLSSPQPQQLLTHGITCLDSLNSSTNIDSWSQSYPQQSSTHGAYSSATLATRSPQIHGLNPSLTIIDPLTWPPTYYTHCHPHERESHWFTREGKEERETEREQRWSRGKNENFSNSLTFGLIQQSKSVQDRVQI